MRIDDLERRSRVKRRTIRHYFDIGLLERPTNHGWKTEYTDEHLLKLRAIRIMRLDRGMSPHDVRAALAKMGQAELETLIGRAAPGAAAAAAAPIPAAKPEPLAAAPASDGGEAWERFVLLPGLELGVRADASPVVKRLAAEIRAQYRQPAG